VTHCNLEFKKNDSLCGVMLVEPATQLHCGIAAWKRRTGAMMDAMEWE